MTDSKERPDATTDTEATAVSGSEAGAGQQDKPLADTETEHVVGGIGGYSKEESDAYQKAVTQGLGEGLGNQNTAGSGE